MDIFFYFSGDNMGYDLLKIFIDISELFYLLKDIYKFLLDEIGFEIEKYMYSIILVLLIFGGMCLKIICFYNVLKKFDSGKVKFVILMR